MIVSRRKADACEEAADEVRRLGHACHMADWDAIDRLVEAAYGAFERVDILVKGSSASRAPRSQRRDRVRSVASASMQ